MKYIKFFGLGIFFGIILSKAEIISWYRIHEMFLFESFHMFGVIGSAVISGIILLQLIKKFQVKTIEGKAVSVLPKKKKYTANLVGGIIFGLGWAMTGACPGPIYILIGNGFGIMAIVLFSALLGAAVHGMLSKNLPE